MTPIRSATCRIATMVLLALLVACGGADTDEPQTGGSESSGSAVSDPEASDAPTRTSSSTEPSMIEVDDWDSVRASAQGQTVNWWMFGGDARVNGYIDEEVAPRASELGVTIDRIPVDDAAQVIQRIIAEVQASETDGGSVDLIWVNGENFAAGKEAGLWLESWARELPNAAYLDWEDPTIAMDFGVPVEGQESPWSRAAFVFAHDTARTPDPPSTFPELLAYAREHPGRVTYPAPPDFTGSAFVRQAVQSLGEDDAFDLLAQLKPLQWREGEAFPANEAELNELFGNGQVDLAMSYDPNFVTTAVDQGRFADTARPFVLDGGTLQNVSYVAIPDNAANQAAALVVANLLLEPELQSIKADPAGLGIPTVLDLDRLSAEQRGRFESTSASPYGLTDFGRRLSELTPERVVEIEERWQRDVLRPAS